MKRLVFYLIIILIGCNEYKARKEIYYHFNNEWINLNSFKKKHELTTTDSAIVSTSGKMIEFTYQNDTLHLSLNDHEHFLPLKAIKNRRAVKIVPGSQSILTISYSIGSSGADINCFSFTDSIKWQASIPELVSSHFKYATNINAIYYENLYIVEGAETGGKYLYIYNATNGEILYKEIIKTN